MILVADSGSTKCDWILVNGDQNISTTTMGFNPFFHDQNLIASKLRENEILQKNADSIKEVHYYGAGCSSPERINIIKEAMAGQFKNVSTWEIVEDLKGAVYATCGNKSGIVCILGTGSNCCYYDGQTIHKGIPSLGYVLGDEGSGSYFGKQIVTHFMHDKLPEDLLGSFNKFNRYSKDDILVSVYKKPHANVFLASFAKFISGHEEHPFFKEMVYKGLKLFSEIYILGQDQHKFNKVHFVGSVAFYFQDVLKKVAKDLGFEIASIIQKPIDNLAEYHSNKQ